MKIAFLNLYSGTNNRGAESFAHELANRLGKKHEIKFYHGIDYQIPIIQPTNRKTFLKLIFLDGAALSALRFTLKIFSELWKGDYDWIVPMNGFWQVLLCKFIIKSKLLITGHSGPGWDEKWNLWLKPHVFVATTEPTADWARKVSPWTKVVTIPYGIDVEWFINIKPAEIELERPIFLCPAAAVEYKRVDLAIRAVANLKKGSLLHLGTGEKLSEINQLGNQILGKKRFSSKSVDHGDMPGYYKACDAVTLPSRPQENSPMVFLEAMAAEKIVVTTDTQRNRWILGENGLFINPENLSEYSQTLTASLLAEFNPKLVERFNWKNVLERYEDIIGKL